MSRVYAAYDPAFIVALPHNIMIEFHDLCHWRMENNYDLRSCKLARTGGSSFSMYSLFQNARAQAALAGGPGEAPEGLATLARRADLPPQLAEAFPSIANRRPPASPARHAPLRDAEEVSETPVPRATDPRASTGRAASSASSRGSSPSREVVAQLLEADAAGDVREPENDNVAEPENHHVAEPENDADFGGQESDYELSADQDVVPPPEDDADSR